MNFDHLNKFYWGEKHPKSYVIDGKGVGLLAPKDFASFNIMLAAAGFQLDTLDDHQVAIGYWVPALALANTPHDANSSLGEMGCLLGPLAFPGLLVKLRINTDFSRHVVRNIEKRFGAVA